MFVSKVLIRKNCTVIDSVFLCVYGPLCHESMCLPALYEIKCANGAKSKYSWGSNVLRLVYFKKLKGG
ncbi:hypothetical protein CDL12_21497 [Handroanthus impetiginosus]|uniref:Uncharacterized protein n=1 Tax=Handroanthus impetiginosus TaxID=429701 RepID=A0A2G9GLQ4_9LAMI|nr:hypothetical protein CDL12_21497 [Handroanthus impetiginosus]